MYIKRYRGWEEHFENVFLKRVPLLSMNMIYSILKCENISNIIRLLVIIVCFLFWYFNPGQVVTITSGVFKTIVTLFQLGRISMMFWHMVLQMITPSKSLITESTNIIFHTGMHFCMLFQVWIGSEFCRAMVALVRLLSSVNQAMLLEVRLQGKGFAAQIASILWHYLSLVNIT